MRWMLLALTLISWSCQEVTNVAVTSEYYPLDSLISAQQEVLSKSQITLEKKAFIDTDSSTALFQPDSLQWRNELDIFKKADITNPSLRGLYSSTISDDPNSNLTILTFNADQPNAEVKFIKLYYLDKIEELRKVEAMWEEKNPLNSSQKKITLLFEDIRDQVLLKSYEITGAQKMIMQDTVRFDVIGKIKY